jgi:L-ribulose-5-phosphate 4-epimerase
MSTISELRERVLEANLDLVTRGLVIQTWGNVSGWDEGEQLFAIKASGVSYDDMRAEHMVLVNLDGKVVEGRYSPSTDTPTHLELYRAWHTAGVTGIVHTHSQFATMWAQSNRDLPALGTTHADYFYGAVPVTRQMTAEEIKSEYEKNTGLVILETFKTKALAPDRMKGVLVASHAPFVWGDSPHNAVLYSEVLEYAAKMAFCNLMMANVPAEKLPPMQQTLLDKHYLRKHGPGAYYGQKG